MTTGCVTGTLSASSPDRRVTVPFDLAALLAAHQGESFELHSQFMNPQLVKVLTTVEAGYVRADRVAGITRALQG
jgi:hypothetical protein